MARFVTSLQSVAAPAPLSRTSSRTVSAGTRRTASTNDFRSLLATARTTAPATAPAKAPVSGLAGLVSGRATVAPVRQDTADPAPVETGPPTAESVFGPDPWISNASGTGPLGVYYYNPMYFATAQTAQKVADMLGGKVVQQNQFCTSGPFQQSQPNYMVQLANGKLVNPGIVASFYSHGLPQSYIDRLVANEVNG